MSENDSRDEPARGSVDISRVVFWITLILTAVTVVFLTGLYSGAKRNSVFAFFNYLQDTVQLVFTEADNVLPGGEPVHFLSPARHSGSGVTVNEIGDDGRLILMTGFFDGMNETRLIERDGTVRARWRAAYSSFFPTTDDRFWRPQSDWNVDLHGAVAMPDGSIVFNFEYNGTVRMARCGDVLWKLDVPSHHSVERSEKGGVWIPGMWFVKPPGDPAYSNPYRPFTEKPEWELYSDDTLMRVSDSGEILEEISLMRVFLDNGMEPLLTATGFLFTSAGDWDDELLHLNKIAELPAALAEAFPSFEAGDLLVSLRQYNLLAVVDPDTWLVKWHQTGPWIRQHDPEFNPDGTITVFNNGSYRTMLGEDEWPLAGKPLTSSIMRVDPAAGDVETIYGNAPGQEFRTVIRGKHDPLPNGHVLITEFEAGRAFQVDPSGHTVWEYVNRYDADRVLEITEARAYDKSYFDVTDWTCTED